MLGFAMRAGKLIIGTEQVLLAMAKTKKPKLVIVSFTASDATKKKILNKSEFYGIKAVQINISQEELGAILGKSYAPVCVAVTDDRFADEIEKAALSEKN